jgi:hypothetical protein
MDLREICLSYFITLFQVSHSVILLRLVGQLIITKSEGYARKRSWPTLNIILEIAEMYAYKLKEITKIE